MALWAIEVRKCDKKRKIHVLCVSLHLWAVPRQIKFWSILKKVGIGSDPPPPHSLYMEAVDLQLTIGAALKPFGAAAAVIALLIGEGTINLE